MIRNFAVVGPGQATRERLTAALAAAPGMAVYRIGRGADPLPVSATFDPSDQAGCRSLLDWFERGAPSGAVLLVDDWALCFEQDPQLDRVVEWIAAFGPSRGVQVVVTARRWDELPVSLQRHLFGEPTDYLALQGVEADLSNVWQRRDYTAAIGVDERGWPVYFEMNVGADGLSGAYLGADRGGHLRAALLGLMVTHSPEDLQFVFVDGKSTGVFGNLVDAPHVAHALDGDTGDDMLERLRVGLEGEINRRQELIHGTGEVRNSWLYRERRDAGADLEPLADLLVCVDNVEAVAERVPAFLDTMAMLVRVGKVVGVRVLISGDSYPLDWPIGLPEWPKAVPTPDFAEIEQVLPGALPAGPIPHQIMLPPLHHMGEFTVDMITSPGSVGLIDNVFLQRRDVLYLGCGAGERHFGVFVGAPGTGKSTALRTLAHALGPDLPGYQLLDGPGEPIDPEKHVVVTARTWAEIPDFMTEKLAFAVEFRLDDPSTSRVDPRLAARLPAHPGVGLFWNNKLVVRIAKS